MLPKLNPVQREDAERLWKSQLRQVVDVRPSQELMMKTTTKSSIPSLELDFIVQLYEFFLAHLVVSTTSTGQQQSSHHDHASTAFLKHGQNPLQSCLGGFSRMALVSATTSTLLSQSSLLAAAPLQPEEFGERNNNNELHDNNNNNSRTKKVIRLFEGRRVVSFHYDDFLSEVHHFMLRGQPETDEWRVKSSFGAFLFHKPNPALACIGTAMSLAMVTLWRGASSSQQQQNTNDQGALQRFLDASKFQVRLMHVGPKVNMQDIKTGSVGKLITVKGHVVKARPKRLRVATADFLCAKCGSCVIHSFDRGRYSIPTKCTSTDCKSRSFIMNRSMASYTNVQELRLQEAQEESTAHSGRTPRQMPVELTHDLVDSCRPGDIVLLACIVDTVNTAVAAGRMGKRAKETSTYTLVLEGHSITTLSESSSQNHKRGGSAQQQSQQQQFSQQQLQSITQLCHADHKYFGMTERMAFPFDLLVRSLCPAIVGHHEVKAGILLCLLGGTPPANSYAKAASGEIRSNSHILIVGDPGMGKSQMLLAASQLAARSVYVGGNTASTTGLTVTLTKEQGGEAGLEAGALVLSDRGCCLIDEFDKMAQKAQDGLLEAMEQQQISIAKAGVIASLPARCSIIAAANPKHGSYNMNKTVSENLNMSKPILSRFDLVFILRDRADQHLDKMVSSNIMNLYRNNGNDSSATAGPIPTPMTQTQMTQESSHIGAGGNGRIPIWERLAWVADFQKTPLPASLVRDYIAYAREYCKPKVTPEAAAVLKDYFMQLRYPENGRRQKDTVPITTRQLEAMIRLSQARAKACLREFVLEGDALDVVELMRRSVDQVHSDETGSLDPTRGGAGGKSNRKMKKLFEARMKEVIGVGAECGIDDLRCIAEQVKCGLGEFKPMIDDLRDKGVLILKPDGRYQVLSG